ncbi:MAG: hypothetical protein IJX22_01210, partial [Opitutales bacterium]|nr:hypothetical protein [Opitutales bacterium]
YASNLRHQVNTSKFLPSAKKPSAAMKENPQVRKLAKIALAVFALAGTLALAACGGPNVYHYGNGTPNITVEQA